MVGGPGALPPSAPRRYAPATGSSSSTITNRNQMIVNEGDEINAEFTGVSIVNHGMINITINK